MTDRLPNVRRVGALGASTLVCVALTLSSGTAALAAPSLHSSVSAAIESAITRRVQTELHGFASGVEKGTGSKSGTTGGKGHTKTPRKSSAKKWAASSKATRERPGSRVRLD